MPALRIEHRGSGVVLAEGPRGWSMTPFETGIYVRRRCLREFRVSVSPVPGLCPYKGLYQWLDLILPDGGRLVHAAWVHWLPNPLLPFIWWRIAFDTTHPELRVIAAGDRDDRSSRSGG